MHSNNMKKMSPSSSSSPFLRSPRSLIRLNLIFLVSSLIAFSPAHSASIVVQELDKSGLETNSIQMQQQNNPQSDIMNQQHQQTTPQTLMKIDEIISSTIQKASRPPATANQHQISSTNDNNNNNVKAEKLLKGLSSFMNPSLNPAAYFVPNSSSQSTLKSQHQKEGGSRKSMMQKTDNSSDTGGSASNQQQIAAEPSVSVNIQAASEGIVNAPTRMARPQNYIFRWGR